MQVPGFDASCNGLGIDDGTFNLTDVSLIIRFNPQTDTSGDVNGDGILQAGEGTELDIKMVNSGNVAARNNSFSNVTVSTGWPFAYNTSASLGDVAPGQTVITNQSSDLDLNIPPGTDGTQFTINMDITTGRTTKNMTFGPLTVGSITNGEVMPTDSGYVVNITGTALDRESEVQLSMDQIEGALTRLRSKSASLSSDLNVVTVRKVFSGTMIDTLETGADNLTLADMNQESANMLMLQTRQSLGLTSLTLASQAAQATLKLF